MSHVVRDLGEAEHLVDRMVRNVEHGRFERSLSGLTAASALVTGSGAACALGDAETASVVANAPAARSLAKPLICMMFLPAPRAQNVLSLCPFRHRNAGARRTGAAFSPRR